MLKHIDQTKLSRAARSKTICKSYRGAKIKQVEENFEKEFENKIDKINGIVMHAGTNNLVDQTPGAAAQEMADIIIKTKTKSENVAISSVIQRHDNQVSPSR